MSEHICLSRNLEQFQDFIQLKIPAREGSRPTTTSATPHSQLSQNAPLELQNRLRDYALSLPGVRKGHSEVAVPGTVAFFLDDPLRPSLIPAVFWAEWGHIHPPYDGSLHMNMPTESADRLISLGWAEYHYVVTQGLVPPVLIMLYGPRNDLELDVASRVIDASYLSAGGDFGPPDANDRTNRSDATARAEPLPTVPRSAKHSPVLCDCGTQ